jgi:hypothetical protein
MRAGLKILSARWRSRPRRRVQGCASPSNAWTGGLSVSAGYVAGGTYDLFTGTLRGRPREAFPGGDARADRREIVFVDRYRLNGGGSTFSVDAVAVRGTAGVQGGVSFDGDRRLGDGLRSLVGVLRLRTAAR